MEAEPDWVFGGSTFCFFHSVGHLIHWHGQHDAPIGLPAESRVPWPTSRVTREKVRCVREDQRMQRAPPLLPLLGLPWKVLSVSGEVEQASPARVRGLFLQKQTHKCRLPLHWLLWRKPLQSPHPIPHPARPLTPPTNQQRSLSSRLFFLSGRRCGGP